MNGPFDLKNYKNLKKIAPFLKPGTLKPPRVRVLKTEIIKGPGPMNKLPHNVPRKPLQQRYKFFNDSYNDSDSDNSSSDSDYY